MIARLAYAAIAAGSLWGAFSLGHTVGQDALKRRGWPTCTTQPGETLRYTVQHLDGSVECAYNRPLGRHVRTQRAS